MSNTLRSLAIPVLIGLVGVLLPVLAALQYRWIGSMSDTEAARLRRSSRIAVTRLADDLDRALSSAHETFLLDVSDEAAEPAAQIAQRLDRWQASAAYPALLSTVYLVTPENGEPHLYAFDAATYSLTPRPWPPELTPWRRHFERLYATRRPDTDGLQPLPEAPAAPPGLTVPYLASLPTPSASDHSEDAHLSRNRYLLLVLDETYARRTLFPQLVDTYFPGDDAAAYDVLIHRRGEPGDVLYPALSPPAATDGQPPDVAADLGLISRIDVTTYRTASGISTQMILSRQDTLAEFAGLSVERNASMDIQAETADETVRKSPGRSGLLPPSANDPGTREQSGAVRPWRLLVRHRAGSIEAAVARIRWRNLAVSFGILLLLGAATGLLLLSARRARRLAARQVAFVAGVTHELRTPLAVIRSAAENLADGVVTNPDQARRYGTLIHQEGRRLSALVEQALALAGAQSAAPTYAFRPLDVATLVDAALDRCRLEQDTRDVAVDVHVEPDLPVLYGDGPALEAALCNLIANAVKYGNGKDRVGLEARRAARGRSSGVVLTVRDHGPGIPVDEQARLFEPFFRGRAARIAAVPGSGLGLSLVKHTVDAHGGHVTVDSTVGRGSTFTLFLPVRREASQRA